MIVNPLSKHKTLLASVEDGNILDSSWDHKPAWKSYEIGENEELSGFDCTSALPSDNGAEADTSAALRMEIFNLVEDDDDYAFFPDEKDVDDLFRNAGFPDHIFEDTLLECLDDKVTNSDMSMPPFTTRRQSPVPFRTITFDENSSYDPIIPRPNLCNPQVDDLVRTVSIFSPANEQWLVADSFDETPVLRMWRPLADFGAESGYASLATKHQHWTEEEDEKLRRAVEIESTSSFKINWKRIGCCYFENMRSGTQCKVRWKNHLKPGIKRGDWQPHEDQTILFMVGQGKKWAEIAQCLDYRIGDNIRERYVNVLDPSLKKTPWTDEEEQILFENQAILGNRWSEIRKHLPGRSENSIKNRYHNRKNFFLRKKKREAEERL